MFDLLCSICHFSWEILASGIFWKWLWNGWEGLTTEQRCNLSKQLSKTLVKCGPFYQKVGQLLGAFDQTKVPKELTDQLKQLQEEIWVDIRPEVKEILKECNINCELEYPPIASGTVAQVHIGYLDGKKIAVKIVKRGIDKKFRDNMRTVQTLCKLSKTKFEEISNIVDYLSQFIVRQTDLSYEHRIINEFRYNNRYVLEREFIGIPKTIGEPDSKVLIMEFIEAESCGNYQWSKLDKEKRWKIADQLTRLIVDSAINDAIMHIDLHPGNLMYNEEKDKLYLIDFGLMGNASFQVKSYQTEMAALFSEKTINYMAIIKKFINQNYIVDPSIFDNEEFIGEMKIYFDKYQIYGKVDFLGSAIYMKDIKNKYKMTKKKNQNAFNIAMLCLNNTILTIEPEYNLSKIINCNRELD